jgi:hypothetical protein
MSTLHDAKVRAAIRARIGALRSDAPRRWGTFSSGQMLWHVNQVLGTSLGEVKVERRLPPFPVAMLKFMLFKLPWPHGAPTAPEYVPQDANEFERERGHCLELIDRFGTRRADEPEWPPAVFGPLTGEEWGRLQYRHIDHHLKQFGG